MPSLQIRSAPWSWSSFVAWNLRFSAAQMFPFVQRYHFHVACLRQHASLPKTLLSILNSTVIHTLLRVLQIKLKLTKIRNGTDTKWLALGFCERASWANCEMREKTNKMQQMFNNISTCFGHHYAHLQENKTMLLHVVCCAVTSWES